MEILDNTKLPDFVSFHKVDAGTTFKVHKFKISAGKSDCIKVRSSDKCLDLMQTKFHGSAVTASWLGSELFSLLSYNIEIPRWRPEHIMGTE